MGHRARHLRWIGLIVWAVLTAGAHPGVALPEECCECCASDGLCSAAQLTGDWCGVRTCFADSGITVYGDNTGFAFGNVAGGARQDFDYAGHGDYLIHVDAGKLGLRDGLFLKLRAEHRYGETITEDVGAFFSPTIAADLPIPNSEQVYLTNVLFTQMLSDSVGIFAGKMDTLDGDPNAFAHGRGKTQFSNLGFVFNPITAATVPYSTLGTGFFILQDNLPVVSFSVLNSSDTTSTSGFRELFNDGVLLSGSIRLPTCFFGRPGHQLIGGTWNSGTYESLDEAYVEYPDVVIPTTRGSWSIFYNFDQYLVVDSCDPLRGWGAFGRAGIADIETNPLAWFLSFGIGGSSPIRSRPADTFGAGWYYGGTSSRIGPILTSVTGPIGDGQAIECFYNYQWTPAIRLTPDFQVIFPARQDIDTALVLGLRMQMIF
jgi:porin